MIKHLKEKFKLTDCFRSNNRLTGWEVEAFFNWQGHVFCCDFFEALLVKAAMLVSVVSKVCIKIYILLASSNTKIYNFFVCVFILPFAWNDKYFGIVIVLKSDDVSIFLKKYKIQFKYFLGKYNRLHILQIIYLTATLRKPYVYWGNTFQNTWMACNEDV